MAAGVVEDISMLFTIWQLKKPTPDDPYDEAPPPDNAHRQMDGLWEKLVPDMKRVVMSHVYPLARVRFAHTCRLYWHEYRPRPKLKYYRMHDWLQKDVVGPLYHDENNAINWVWLAQCRGVLTMDMATFKQRQFSRPWWNRVALFDEALMYGNIAFLDALYTLGWGQHEWDNLDQPRRVEYMMTRCIGVIHGGNLDVFKWLFSTLLRSITRVCGCVFVNS